MTSLAAFRTLTGRNAGPDAFELSDQIARAFKVEELKATRRSRNAALVTLIIIAVWLQVMLPFREALFYEAILTGVAIIILADSTLKSSRFARPWHSYVIVLGLYGLFAFGALVPNPLDSTPWPPQMQQRFGLFVFGFVFLVPLTFNYSPSLMLWGGAACAGMWSVGIIRLLNHPATITAAPRGTVTSEQELAIFLDPNFVNIDMWVQNLVVMAMVSGALAGVIARSRRLVFGQAQAARERGNLARYFPPTVVDRLAEMDEPLGSAKSQPVAVLFADIVGFSRIAEGSRPEQVFDLLRDFHGRLERAVFDHGGTLDKFLGDGVMATFGTPDTSAADAGNAIACGHAMLAAVAQLNQRRTAEGLAPIRLSVGIHHGQVLLGDIGSERRLEFAVLGDVVNVASRLEHLTRELDCCMVISDDLVAAAGAESTERATALTAEFKPGDAQSIRGREQPVAVWCLGDAAADRLCPRG